MTVKSCVFCGLAPPVVKITKEHVIKSSLRKYLGPQKMLTTWRQKFRPSHHEKIVLRRLDIPQTGFDATVNDVCKTCNEGWLDLLVERPAERYLMSLIIGYPLPFSADFFYRVSLWAAKTSATRALMDQLPRSIPPEHYFFIKNNLQPPPFTFIFLANTSYSETPITRHLRFSTLRYDGHIESRSHFTTFIIGNMALYVIGASEESGLSTYIPTIENLLTNGVIQIWPINDVSKLSIPQIPLRIAIGLSEYIRDQFVNNEMAGFPVSITDKYTFQI